MAKTRKILELLPCAYGAMDPTKLLHVVVSSLAAPLDENDGHLYRIQRAHRVDLADTIDDLLKLAELLHLGPVFFEDLLTNAADDYETCRDRVRERLMQLAGLHLRGLGTPGVLLASTGYLLSAAFIDGKPFVPQSRWIRRLDAEGYVHTTKVSLAETPRLIDRIALVENPSRRVVRDFKQRWPLDGWTVNNGDAAGGATRVAIRGVADRTVFPTVFCHETNQGILFEGIVPDGALLVFDESGAATLDDRPVDDWLIRFVGGVTGFDDFDSATVSLDQGAPSGIFAGDVDRLLESPDRERKTPLSLNSGKTQWYFSVAEGSYNKALTDFAVYVEHHEPIAVVGDNNFDQSVYDYLPHGEVGMSWRERINNTFKLIVPQHIDIEAEQPRNEAGQHAARIGKTLDRFKAAGINGYVEAESDCWIIGETKIRSADATEGEGASYYRALLRNEAVDTTLHSRTNS